MKHLNQAGDTIVEIMIALSITSFLLVIAYSTASKSLTGAQQSQDRGQAIKVAESQAEALRLLTSPATAPNTFCMSNAATPTVTTLSASIPIDFSTDTASSYAVGCVQGIYRISVIHPAVPSPNFFTVRVRWQRANEVGTDEVIINYSVF